MIDKLFTPESSLSCALNCKEDAISIEIAIRESLDKYGIREIIEAMDDYQKKTGLNNDQIIDFGFYLGELKFEERVTKTIQQHLINFVLKEKI